MLCIPLRTWDPSGSRRFTMVLRMVARSTALAKLTFAIPAWWGYAYGEEKDLLERLLRRVERAGFILHDAPTVAEMPNEAHDRLLASIRTNSGHWSHSTPTVPCGLATVRSHMPSAL